MIRLHSPSLLEVRGWARLAMGHRHSHIRIMPDRQRAIICLAMSLYDQNCV
jgi:hypothetical protein